jgi:hypothetical protein
MLTYAIRRSGVRGLNLFLATGPLRLVVALGAASQAASRLPWGLAPGAWAPLGPLARGLE